MFNQKNKKNKNENQPLLLLLLLNLMKGVIFFSIIYLSYNSTIISKDAQRWAGRGGGVGNFRVRETGEGEEVLENETCIIFL